MKKIAALVLCLLLMGSLIGCGGTAPALTPTEAPTPAPTPVVTPEPTRDPLLWPELALGEELAEGGVSITLERAETLGAIPSVKKGEGIVRNAPEGYQYLTITGTIKNNGETEIDADNITGQVRINGKYVYDLEKYVIQGLLFKTELPPLAKGTLWLYAEVPDELAGQIEECTAAFGYNESLDVKTPLEVCSVARTVTLTAGENLTVNHFAPEELTLGEEITTDFAALTLQERKVMTRFQRKYKGNVYAYSLDKDMAALCLEGMVRNTSQESCRPAFSGTVTVDGYTYELKEWMISSSLLVPPLNEVPVYLFAVIPPELAESYSHCEFRIGFNDDFANNAYTDFDACRYEYIYTWESEEPPEEP